LNVSTLVRNIVNENLNTRTSSFDERPCGKFVELTTVRNDISIASTDQVPEIRTEESNHTINIAQISIIDVVAADQITQLEKENCNAAVAKNAIESTVNNESPHDPWPDGISADISTARSG